MSRDTHMLSFGLPLHTKYSESTTLGTSKWLTYEWTDIVTCHIQDDATLSVVVINDYSGGGSVYTTVHTSLIKAVEVLKLALTPHADVDREKARLISQMCRHLAHAHGALTLEERLSPQCKEHLVYHQFSLLECEKKEGDGFRTTVSW